MPSLPRPTVTRQFGWAVAISHDGNTVVAGDAYDDVAVVYLRNGNTWTMLELEFPSGASGYGDAVGISGDGNTVAVGYAITGGGRVAVFSRLGRWASPMLVAAARARCERS